MPIPPNIVRLALGIPGALAGGAIGYATGDKKHHWENVSRGAGIGYMTGAGIGAGSAIGDYVAPEGESSVPHQIAGGLSGGLLGMGAGRLIQGQPEHVRRKEILEILRKELNRPSVIQNILEKHSASPTIEALLRAKALSDIRKYREKHDQLRALIAAHPADFVVDSEDGNIVGLTHRSGFRIHSLKDDTISRLRRIKPGQQAWPTELITAQPYNA
jgi:hypothetical protein